jgi:glycosyltransferase involved in cell wall biosynthesis
MFIYKSPSLVSVIIPTFRRSDFLVRSIKSAINQSYKNIEIIVVDDNQGNDFYRVEVKSKIKNNFGTDTLTYIEHGSNKGLPAARNTGIRAAKGQFIAFLDDDDEWLPQKIEKQMELFESLSESYGVVSCGWNLIHSVNHYEKQVYPNARGDLSKILGVNHFSPPSMILVKRSFLEAVQGFDENFRWRQDVELYFRLSQHCLFDFVDECLVNYYFHEGSMSRNVEQKLNAINQFIDKHKVKLLENKVPWSEIHERKGDLAASSGKLIVSTRAFVVAFSNRPTRVQILGKLVASFFGAQRYRKIRGIK